MRTIQRVGPLSAGEFAREFAATETPVILTRVIDDWPARRRWSADYFKRKFGAVELVEGGRLGDNQHFLAAKKTERMPLHELRSPGSITVPGFVHGVTRVR